MKLTQVELDKSLRIIESHGCSDFFPVPFETLAIRHKWNKIRPVLESVDLLSYTPLNPYKTSAPKQKYTVRPISLIDPIDSILITGLLLRVAPIIESTRLAANTVFSHRHKALPNALYQDFHGSFEQTIFQNSFRHAFIGRADIADFYPRVYLHRLENALAAALGPAPETKAIMRFLDAWAGGTSYGIPVGPHFAATLAEALLDEVDDFLQSRGVNFIRFNDDIAIFADSYQECLSNLFLLGERLQNSQGLILNAAKTAIVSSTDYRKSLASIRPDREIHLKILRNVFNGNPYAHVKYEDLTEEQKKLVSEVDAVKMLERTLDGQGPIVDLAPARFALGVLSALSRPDLIETVLDNLPRLYPLSHSVAQFFASFDQLDQSTQRQIGSRIMDYIRRSPSPPSFQVMWLLTPFTRSAGWNNLDALRQLAENHPSQHVRREATLAIGRSGDRGAMLDAKDRISRTSGWEKRACIFATQGLPVDEREALIKYLTRRIDGDWRLQSMLEKATICFTKDTAGT